MKSGIKLILFAIALMIFVPILNNNYGSEGTIVILISLFLIMFMAFALDAIVIMKIIKRDIKPSLDKISSTLDDLNGKLGKDSQLSEGKQQDSQAKEEQK